MRIRVITVIFCLFPILSFSEVKGSDWSPFEMTITNDVWYYKKTMNYPSKDTAEVWTKTVYSEQSIKVKKRSLITSGITEGEQKRQGYDKFKWSITLWEIRCNNKKIRPLNSTDYSEDGGVLSSENLQSVMKDEPMIPDSILDNLYEKVCEKDRSAAKDKRDSLFTW